MSRIPNEEVMLMVIVLHLKRFHSHVPIYKALTILTGLKYKIVYQ